MHREVCSGPRKTIGADIVFSEVSVRLAFCAPVAQLDRAIASEAIGREFDSHRVHHFRPQIQMIEMVSAHFGVTQNVNRWATSDGIRPFQVGTLFKSFRLSNNSRDLPFATAVLRLH